MDNYLLSIKDRAGNECSINVSIQNLIAPANEYQKWNYTLDNVNNTITLNQYTGTDENVTVYANYDVGGVNYKTDISSNYTNNVNKYMFQYNKTIKNIIFQKQIDTSNVTNMKFMFYDCEALESVDLSNFDTSNVTNMNQMFSGCKTLTSIIGLSNFNTSKVTNMASMFDYCSSFTSLDVSNFDTSNVTYIFSMFSYCTALTSLDVSNFDTSNAIKMNSMFENCTALTSIIGLSNFDTSKVKDMNCMFRDCEALESVDLSNFDTSNVTNMNQMFKHCQKMQVIYVNENTWKTSQADTTNMFDNCGVSEVTYKDAA